LVAVWLHALVAIGGRVAKQVVQVRIQAPLGPPSKQKEVLDSEKRFKLLRWGRRASKTRTAFIAAAVGHGSKPNGKGFIQGGEILWVARDYPNSDTIWRKEILRRFANKPGFKINKQDKRVEMDNGGSLTICSADNIDSVRGGNWDGVIVDEAGHLDLLNVWYDVLRWGLADTEGWGIIMSTTKAGSYFNELCERVMSGEMGEVWGHWHSTAYDNPKISDDEIREAIEEYADEVKLKQEFYAELVVPGGLAFAEWMTGVHTFKHEIPEHWPLVGCMDWGYSSPGVFLLAGCGPDGEVHFRWEYKFKGKEPFDVGYQIGTAVSSRFRRPLYIVGDSAMDSTDHSEVTVMDHVRAGLKQAMGEFAPPVIPSVKGRGSRARGVALMHTALKWTPDAENPSKPRGSWAAPRLRFHEECAYAITSIPKLRRSEKDSEDVDTTQDDHAFDAVRYLLVTHRPGAERLEREQEKPKVDSGWRERPWMKAQEEYEPDVRYWRGA
jgi:hypothetical protein